jgi:hypothetical protein
VLLPTGSSLPSQPAGHAWLSLMLASSAGNCPSAWGDGNGVLAVGADRRLFLKDQIEKIFPKNVCWFHLKAPMFATIFMYVE